MTDPERRIFGVRPRFLERAVGSNRIVLYLAGFTAVLSVAGGAAMRILNPDAFPSIGQGVWWAMQTVTTVGYGDIVPSNGWGKFVGGIVMLFGVTFLSLVTALVTSALITGEQRRREQAAAEDENRAAHESLARIEARLEAIEQRLAG